MIIVDDALRARQEQGKPIRVGMIGAGFMARGLTNQIVNSVPGMKVVAIFNRRIERAIDAFTYASDELKPVIVETQDALEDALRAGKAAVTQDAFLLARSPQIDVLVETTGSVEFGAQVCLEAFKHGKDVVLLNAEIDATIGPILQVYAKKHGVVLSACDGGLPSKPVGRPAVPGLPPPPEEVCASGARNGGDCKSPLLARVRMASCRVRATPSRS